MGIFRGGTNSRVETGVTYTDEVLDGGLLPESATLIRGEPGAGKTIFGIQFLAAGAEGGETGLYINLGEPAEYLQDTSQRFGFDIDSVEALNLSGADVGFEVDSNYDLFHSGQVESSGLIETIRDTVDTTDPDRVVVDPVTELRYLNPDEHQFRTQIMGLLEYLKSTGATILLTSQASPSIPDDGLQFLVDTVLTLAHNNGRRTLCVSKFRGSSSRSGNHSVTIDDDGMSVWPRLDLSGQHRSGSIETFSTGISELDSLLGGGLKTGTNIFLSGPTGAGKTTVGLQLLAGAAANDRQSVLYSFEEGKHTMFERANVIGLPIESMVEEGMLTIEVIDPETITVDEFTHRIRTEVEQKGSEIVMIDGLSGYERAFESVADDPERQFVNIMRYLRNMNVTGLVTNEVHQITGDFQATEQHVSHLADDIIFLRHVEYKGELLKIIGVLKRRASDFEGRLRALQISDSGLTVGEPLTDLRGILTGTPEWTDND